MAALTKNPARQRVRRQSQARQGHRQAPPEQTNSQSRWFWKRQLPNTAGAADWLSKAWRL